jgi:hypothetical protein
LPPRERGQFSSGRQCVATCTDHCSRNAAQHEDRREACVKELSTRKRAPTAGVGAISLRCVVRVRPATLASPH